MIGMLRYGLLTALVLTVVSCGDSSSPAAQTDFSLVVSPVEPQLTVGGATNLNIAVSGSAGFSGEVALAASTLPEGVTAQFSKNPTSTASLLTLRAANTVKPGAYPFTVSGTSGSLGHASTLTLKVVAASFSLSADQRSLSVTAGTTGAIGLTSTAAPGFILPVSFSVLGPLTSGLRVTFDPNPASGAVRVSFTVAATVTAGTYPITLQGAAGGSVQTLTVQLNVMAASAPDYVLSLTPASQTVTAGLATTYTVNLQGVAGYASSVNLALGALPDGVTATLAPITLTPGQSSTLTVKTTPATPASASNLSVLATDGFLDHTTLAGLTVVPDRQPPTATLTASPTSVEADGTLTLTVDAADNVGVTAVDFLEDGKVIGSVQAAPFVLAVPVQGPDYLDHVFSARVSDAARNVTTLTVMVPVRLRGVPGQMDATFGQSGAAEVQTGTRSLLPVGTLAPNSQGQVRVFALDASTVTLLSARFTVDGVPDSSYGAGGVARTVLPANPAGGSTAYLDVRPVSNGDALVLIGGAVCRVSAAGSVVASFATGGCLSGNNLVLRDAVEQANGTFIAAGYEAGPNLIPVLLRYDADGAPDPTFGTQGKIRYQPTSSAYFQTVSVLPDGKLLAGGRDYAGGDQTLMIQTSREGVLDVTFGNGSGVVIDRDSHGAFGFTRLPDGRFYSATWNDSFVPSVVRYLSSGARDITFGTGGQVSVRGLRSSATRQVLLLPQSGILALTLGGAGFETRVSSDGVRDQAFNLSGANFAAGSNTAAMLVGSRPYRVLVSGISGSDSGVLRLQAFWY